MSKKSQNIPLREKYETYNGVKYSKKSKNIDPFKDSDDKWECQTCLMLNSAKIKKCIACEENRPN